MAQLCRLRVEWSGSAVTGPGISTFYIPTSGSGFPAAVLAFFNAIKANFPTSITWTVPQAGDLIEDTTGALAGTWAEGSGGGQVSGTVAGAFARGVGAQVRWHTGGIRHGRRVVGSTFLVPFATGAYDTDGSLQPSTVTLLQTSALTLALAQPLKILSKATKGTSDGQSSFVTAPTIPDRVSWLRSRRT